MADVVVPLEERLLTTLARPRLYAMLIGGFATFALVVAAVGLFGLLSSRLAPLARDRDTNSSGGAPGDILRLVLRQGLGVTLGGRRRHAGVGVAQPGRVSQLYGVTTHDTPTFVLVPVLLVAVGMLACLLPARRAATLTRNGSCGEASAPALPGGEALVDLGEGRLNLLLPHRMRRRRRLALELGASQP